MQFKSITLFAALFMSTAGQAEWSYIGSSTHGTDEYIDFSTIRKTPNGYRVWGIHDYKTRHRDGNLSNKWISEYDCKDERVRSLQEMHYSGHMGEGEIMYSSRTPGNWQYVSPESMGAIDHKLVCGRGIHPAR